MTPEDREFLLELVKLQMDSTDAIQTYTVFLAVVLSLILVTGVHFLAQGDFSMTIMVTVMGFALWRLMNYHHKRRLKLHQRLLEQIWLYYINSYRNASKDVAGLISQVLIWPEGVNAGS